ncbi:SWIM zinc finger family protein [Nonomuraea sp. NPDC049714]|uniref:SWIM zinc finger family protein n=1 Tax=Nonomuraea sp. NPDC049714 TaxID=3364357 RepID=UPI00378EBC85
MIERWSRDQVLALAPDAPSKKAAQGVATPGKWSLRGTTGDVVFGECKGSGAKPYLAAVDLTEPAYRCSCPSRKFPCKHALGLLLLWSAEGVAEVEAVPSWVAEWLAQRADRAAKSAARVEAARAASAAENPDGAAGSEAEGAAGSKAGSGADGAEGLDAGSGADGAEGLDAGSGAGGPAGSGSGSGLGGPAGSGGGSGLGGAVGGRAAGAESVRHTRVAAGLAELERWLADQVRQGLSGAAEDDWAGLAKRLIDAQAPGVAGIVSRLARVRAVDGWPGRLLEEYSLLHLLAVAYRQRAELPADLAQTVLMRVGFPVTREEVLAGPVTRDRWDVLGSRDEEQDRLAARRVWLRGRRTGRAALILSFAPPGQALDASLVTGTTIDADLAFYPGASPLRALVATRHRATDPTTPTATHGGVRGVAGDAGGSAERGGHGFAGGGSGDGAARGGAGVAEGRVPPGATPEEAMEEIGAVLAGDPWADSWPIVLAGVVPEETSLGGFPLHPRRGDIWRLLAVSGGRPLTVAAEWTPQGIRPLTTWDEDEATVIL